MTVEGGQRANFYTPSVISLKHVANEKTSDGIRAIDICEHILSPTEYLPREPNQQIHNKLVRAGAPRDQGVQPIIEIIALSAYMNKVLDVRMPR